MNNKLKELLVNKETQKQFFRYLLVGGSTAFFEIILYTFLRRIIGFDLIISNIIATMIAMFLNFLLNKGCSFNSTSNFSRSLALYIVLFIFNLSFSTIAISAMVHIGLIDIFSKFIAMGLITLWNFIIYKKIVFI